jgi:8-oxo-dGTP pyrophosphatase MutT (NUDIX family)
VTIRPWPVVGEPESHDFGIFRVRRFRARSPRTGDLRPFTVLETADWVNVIALTGDDRLVLVRQYRHGRGDVGLEIPGGVIDPGEDPGAAAARELLEETGYAGATPVRLGVVDPNPAILSNRCHTYRIDGCERVAEPRLDPGEDIAVETMPASEVDAAIADGRITHSLVLCAIAWWRTGSA